jgi:hypothetical protein
MAVMSNHRVERDAPRPARSWSTRPRSLKYILAAGARLASRTVRSLLGLHVEGRRGGARAGAVPRAVSTSRACRRRQECTGSPEAEGLVPRRIGADGMACAGGAWGMSPSRALGRIT